MNFGQIFQTVSIPAVDFSGRTIIITGRFLDTVMFAALYFTIWSICALRRASDWCHGGGLKIEGCGVEGGTSADTGVTETSSDGMRPTFATPREK